MAFPSIFIIFLIFVFIFQHHMRKTTRQEKLNREKFWNEEKKSLSTRRKNFSQSDYIIPNLSKLTYPTIISIEPGQHLHYQQVTHQLKELSSMDLMNYSDLTNTEIRIRFGTANQTVIAQNEANYNRFLKVLAEYGYLMLEFEEVEEAIIAFEECVRLGSDYSNHYLTLAHLYLQKNQDYKVSKLKEKAQALNSLNKSVILKKLATL